MMSISSTLSVRDFRTKFWCKNFQTQNTAFVQNFGAKNALSYKKCTHKMLMKLTHDVGEIEGYYNTQKGILSTPKSEIGWQLPSFFYNECKLM